MTEQRKIDGRTKRALDTAIAKRQVSQDSYYAVLEGRISLADAKELGREGSPNTPLKLVSRISKDDRTRECMCRCGKSTKGRFAMGHDARVKGWILKAVRAGDLSDLTEEQVAYGRERGLIEGE